MKKLDDYELVIKNHSYVPIMVGGMGVDISTRSLALVAAKLGGIGHISDAMLPTVMDKDFKTKYVKNRLKKYKFNVSNPDKSAVQFDLDEIAEARPDVIVAIHSLTDHRRELFIDKLGEVVKAHEDFMLVASFNPGYQRGFKELKPSTRQRFVALSFAYPDEKLEAEILINETGIDPGVSKKLVNIANKIRNLTELGLTETVSTRLLVDAAKLIHSGLPKRLAVKVAVVEPLTDDLEITEALVDLCNLMI